MKTRDGATVISNSVLKNGAMSSGRNLPGRLDWVDELMASLLRSDE